MLYIVAGLFVVLLVLCFMSLVSFTGFYTEGEPKFGGEQIFPATYVAAYVDVDCLLLVSSFCSFYFFCSYSPT